MAEDETRWYHLSLCRGMRTNLFYDDYESSEELAKTVDGICDACPVKMICRQEGYEKKEYGVWGGVFLINGKPTKARNEHKEDLEWKRIMDDWNSR